MLNFERLFSIVRDNEETHDEYIHVSNDADAELCDRLYTAHVYDDAHKLMCVTCDLLNVEYCDMVDWYEAVVDLYGRLPDFRNHYVCGTISRLYSRIVEND